MFKKTSSLKRITLLGSLLAVLVVFGLSDLADAGPAAAGDPLEVPAAVPEAEGSAAAVRPNPLGSPSSPSVPPPSPGSGSVGGGSSFMRGVGGGLVGGMIGNMLFGRSGYGAGGGGVGGGGIGYFRAPASGGAGLFSL